MLWLKLNKYRSLFSRKLSELTGRTRMHLRRLQWADWVVFNRLAKSNHILEIIRLEKHAGAKNQDPRTAAGPVGFSGTLMTHEANFSCDDAANQLFFSKLDFFRFSSIPTLNYSSHFHQTSSDRTKVQKWSSTQSKKTRSWTSSRMHSNKHKLLQYLQSRLSRCCTSTHRNISKCNASKTDENMIKPFSLWTLWRLYSHSQETPHS